MPTPLRRQKRPTPKRPAAVHLPAVTGRAQAALPARRRISAEARRAQIIGVAEKLFRREGIDSTSLRRIAAEAGVTAPLLYRHFADKDALLLAICDGFFAILQERFERAYRTGSTPLARLDAVMRAYVQCGFDHPHEYELTFMTALPKLRSHNAMRKVRAQRQRGEAVSPEDENGGTRVFGLLEGVVREVLNAHAGPVAGNARSTRNRSVAALSEVIWASGHGLVALVNTHQNFGFVNRRLLIDTAVSSMLHGIERMTVPPRETPAAPRKVARRTRKDPS